MRIKRIRFLILLTAFLAVIYLTCDHGTDIDEITPPERDFRCGDPNGDESINVLDLTCIISYLFGGVNIPDTVAADVDLINGVTINDLSYLINYIFHQGLPPECPVFFGDTVLPVLQDTVKMSSRIISPGNSIWSVDVFFRASEQLGAFTLPLKYSCGTSPIICDSIIYSAHPNKMNYFYSLFQIDSIVPIDTISQEILVLYAGWSGVSFPDETLLASLWFSVTPSDNPQEIILDTTIYKPSNIVIISRYKKPETIASVPVIIF